MNLPTKSFKSKRRTSFLLRIAAVVCGAIALFAIGTPAYAAGKTFCDATPFSEIPNVLFWLSGDRSVGLPNFGCFLTDVVGIAIAAVFFGGVVLFTHLSLQSPTSSK